MEVTMIERVEMEYGVMDTVEVIIETPKHRINAYNLNECPEDAILTRDLSFIYSVPDMIKEAYEAGKNGEEFKIVYKDEED